MGGSFRSDRVILGAAHSRSLLECANPSYSPTSVETNSAPIEDALIQLLLFGAADVVGPQTEPQYIGGEFLRSEGFIDYLPKRTFERATALLVTVTQDLSRIYLDEFGGLGLDEFFDADAWAYPDQYLHDRSDEELFPHLDTEGTVRAGLASSERIVKYILPILNLVRAQSPLLYHRSAGDLLATVLRTSSLVNVSTVLDACNISENYNTSWDNGFNGIPHESSIIYGDGGSVLKDVFHPPGPEILVRDTTEFAEIAKALIEVSALTELSRTGGFSMQSKYQFREGRLDKSLGPDACQLFRIHLDEIRFMPHLETIEDLLRLRSHPALDDFRVSLMEWLDRVNNGETEVEEKYRKSIQVANAELKKLDKWKPLKSGYTLVASLAVSAADYFMGTGYGFLLAPASVAAFADRVQKNRDYGYAIFPR